MVDQFKGVETAISPARHFYDAAPDDDNDLPYVPKGIISNDGGDVCMVGGNGNEVTVTLVAGVVYPFAPVRIKATGTTSTAIVALH